MRQSVRVVSVRRVQNPALWRSYAVKRAFIPDTREARGGAASPLQPHDVHLVQLEELVNEVYL